MVLHSTQTTPVEPSRLAIRLFGAFELTLDGRALVMPRAACQLLSLLCLARGQPRERAMLATRLWPEASHDRALFYLRRALTEIRKALGDEWRGLVASRGGRVGLDMTTVFCDVSEFDSLAGSSNPEHLGRVAALYRGDLLSTWDGDWILFEREKHSRMYVEALEKLADDRATNGDLGEAVRLLHAALGVEPLKESLHCGLMTAMARSRDRAGVERQYRELRRILRDELNTAPSPQLEAAYLRATEKAGAPGSEEPAGAVSGPYRKLPVPTTSLIGREADIAAVAAASDLHRLVTLTGPGGVGKTRLAVAVAESRSAVYLEGMAFVDLSSIGMDLIVPEALAAALGVRTAGSAAPIDAVCAWLAPKRFLLVLDNCEHITGGVASVAQSLLSKCPFVHLLCTSRVALGQDGEHAVKTRPLEVPPAAVPVNLRTQARDLLQYSSVEAFVARACAANPRFKLTATNLEDVARVCRAVDGLPLGIELAASRVRNHSAAEIVAAMNERLARLSHRSASTARHRSLTSAIAWSYHLLEGGEQRLLRRLSIFRGGWTLHAAERVCDADGSEDSEALGLLTSMVDKSLVSADSNGRFTRYRLLEMVRQYARDRLLENGESEVYRGRHLAFYLTLAEEAQPHLTGVDQADWLELLEQEHDNLRTALESSAASQEGGYAGLRLCSALQVFWSTRGHLSEGRLHCAMALAHDGARERTAVRAKVLNGAGNLARGQGDFAAARSLYEQALAINRELGIRRLEAGNLNNLGLVAMDQGDFAAARSLYEQALIINRETGNRAWEAINLANMGLVAVNEDDYTAARLLCEQALIIDRELGNREAEARNLNNLGIATMSQGDYSTSRLLTEQALVINRELGHRAWEASNLGNLGNIARTQGDHSAANSLYEQALVINRELANRAGEGTNLGNLGIVAINQRDYAAARTLLEQALTIHRELGCRSMEAGNLGNLGIVALDQGDHATACSLLKQALAINCELGSRLRVGLCLEEFAALAAARNRPARAVALWGYAEPLREEMGAPRPPCDQPRYSEQVAASRSVLGDDAAFDAAWQQGRAMKLEEAIELALQTEFDHD
jgi:predicted ATPase/DNA-binding SARP family transcriptional activator/Tfp pilus assembly protein PilF